MFGKKKYKFSIEVKNNKLVYNHNIDEKLSQELTISIVSSLINGDFGRLLLNDLYQNPSLRELSKDMYITLHPVPVVQSGPVIKPSQVLPNFINQIKGMING